VIYCGTLRRKLNTDHLLRPALSST